MSLLVAIFRAAAHFVRISSRILMPFTLVLACVAGVCGLEGSAVCAAIGHGGGGWRTMAQRSQLVL